jgi:transposase-like protein
VERLTHTDRRARRGEIAAFCARDKTVAEAAAKFGCGATLVLTACREAGVEPKRKTVADPSRLRLVAALVNTTTSFSALAKRHGVTRQAIEKFAGKCVAAGLKVRSRRASA